MLSPSRIPWFVAYPPARHTFSVVASYALDKENIRYKYSEPSTSYLLNLIIILLIAPSSIFDRCIVASIVVIQVTTTRIAIISY